MFTSQKLCKKRNVNIWLNITKSLVLKYIKIITMILIVESWWVMCVEKAIRTRIESTVPLGHTTECPNRCFRQLIAKYRFISTRWSFSMLSTIKGTNNVKDVLSMHYIIMLGFMREVHRCTRLLE